MPVATAEEKVQCTQKLDSLSVQYKFREATCLETSTHLWNRLLLGFHSGQLSFVLRAFSDTLPTPMNLQPLTANSVDVLGLHLLIF